MSIWGWLAILSIILLIIGYGTDKTFLCVPAYLFLMSLVINLIVISWDKSILGVIIYGVIIIVMLVPFAIVLKDIIAKIIEKISNKKNRN